MPYESPDRVSDQPENSRRESVGAGALAMVVALVLIAFAAVLIIAFGEVRR